MTICIENHDFAYETENVVRLFYPDEKLVTVKDSQEMPEKPFVITRITRNDNGTVLLSARLCMQDFDKTSEYTCTPEEASDEKETERLLAVCLYDVLCACTDREQPWGILTGVRPIKLFRRLKEDRGEQYALDYFTKKLLVSEPKAKLAALTETYESKIISLSRPESVSIYISIPFCPTRCSYCSFVSQTIESAKKLIEPYFGLLLKEIEYTGKIVAAKKLRLESIYIGGGTPTTLSAVQLHELIKTIYGAFDMSTCREFTIEAGRPDTIDEAKLCAILEGGCDRISINPQTLNDSVLEVIGRKHNSAQTVSAFTLARRLGFRHINMDLIAGLPADTADSFRMTLDRICALAPESITVHTLAMKRSSRLTLSGSKTGEGGCAGEMLDYAGVKLPECAYHPYYLYRQTRMEGNLENVGWSKDGFDGIYNIYVMDETHTILGCGAGAVTKLKVPFSNELTRIFNYKYPYEYINGFEEMIRRKDQVVDFYDRLS